jgi:ketosteroid isomerase-like protein
MADPWVPPYFGSYDELVANPLLGRRGLQTPVRDTIMRKFAAITKEKWVFAAVMAIACVWGTNSYAQSDADAVKAAVAAYTAAVDSLDPAKMEALWVHDDTVMDIEPGSRTIAVGWDAVKKFIDGNFLVFAELKNVLADGPHVQIKGDLARSMGIAMVTYKLKNGTAASVNVFLSHVFEKHDGAWLLVSQFVAPVPK